MGKKGSVSTNSAAFAYKMVKSIFSSVTAEGDLHHSDDVYEL